MIKERIYFTFLFYTVSKDLKENKSIVFSKISSTFCFAFIIHLQCNTFFNVSITSLFQTLQNLYFFLCVGEDILNLLGSFQKFKGTLFKIKNYLFTVLVAPMSVVSFILSLTFNLAH